jgi:hypothetical protein
MVVIDLPTRDYRSRGITRWFFRKSTSSELLFPTIVQNIFFGPGRLNASDPEDRTIQGNPSSTEHP